MSKKTLNTAGITNELEGASLFFQSPPPPKSEAVVTPPQEKGQTNYPIQPMTEPKNERPNVPPNEGTNVARKSRIKVRHTFDIYQDQLLALQAVQLEAVQRGKKKPKLGDMVQKAIDSYLKKIVDRKTSG
jgi:hypothetical protein